MAKLLLQIAAGAIMTLSVMIAGTAGYAAADSIMASANIAYGLMILGAFFFGLGILGYLGAVTEKKLLIFLYFSACMILAMVIFSLAMLTFFLLDKIKAEAESLCQRLKCRNGMFDKECNEMSGNGKLYADQKECLASHNYCFDSEADKTAGYAYLKELCDSHVKEENSGCNCRNDYPDKDGWYPKMNENCMDTCQDYGFKTVAQMEDQIMSNLIVGGSLAIVLCFFIVISLFICGFILQFYLIIKYTLMVYNCGLAIAGLTGVIVGSIAAKESVGGEWTGITIAVMSGLLFFFTSVGFLGAHYEKKFMILTYIIGMVLGCLLFLILGSLCFTIQGQIEEWVDENWESDSVQKIAGDGFDKEEVVEYIEANIHIAGGIAFVLSIYSGVGILFAVYAYIHVGKSKLDFLEDEDDDEDDE